MERPTQPVEQRIFRVNIWRPKFLGGAGLQLLAPILGGAFTGLKTGGPIGALIGGPLGGALEYSGMRESLTGETPSPKTNFFETINPFARLGGMFGRKFSEKGEVEKTGTGEDKEKRGKMTPYDFIQEKGLKVTDIEDGFRRMVHIYNPDVQDKDGNYRELSIRNISRKRSTFYRRIY